MALISPITPQQTNQRWQDAIFFALFFLFMGLWINPALFYYNFTNYGNITNSGLFYIWSYHDMAAYPGKLIDYLESGVTHLFFYPWLGAAILTAVAWALCAGIGLFQREFGGGGALLRFIPAIILMMQVSRYEHHVSDSLSLVSAVVLALTIIPVRRLHAAIRIALYCIISIVLCITAIRAYPVFALLWCGCELFARRRPWVAAALLLIGICIPAATNALVYDIPWAVIYAPMFPGPGADAVSTVLRHALFWSLPAVGFAPFISRFFAWAPRIAAKIIKRPRLQWAVTLAGIMAITGASIACVYDPARRQRLRMDCFFHQEQWKRYLREVRTLKPNRYSPFDGGVILRAMYHSGILLDSMFTRPQDVNYLIPSEIEKKELVGTRLYMIATFLELGYVNMAEDWAYEATSLYAYPPGMHYLALIHAAKGEPDAARTYLNALRRDFVFRRYATDFLAKLDRDPMLVSDTLIGRMRRNMPDCDTVNIGTLFSDLLLKNPQNRMAFEYAVAFSLLRGALDSMVASVGYLRALGYDRIPRHVEEALLLFEMKTGAMPDLRGLTISESSRRRFGEFVSTMNRYQGDRSAALREAAGKFGNTYFFYFVFGFSGAK